MIALGKEKGMLSILLDERTGGEKKGSEGGG